MCIIVVKPENTVLEERTLLECFKYNRDGAGFAVPTGKEVLVKKGYFSFEEFWRAWKEYEKELAVLHFRIGTHGLRNEANCHPFTLRSEEEKITLAFAHNGIFHLPKMVEKMSDTYAFGELYFKPLLLKYPDIWKDVTFITAFEEFLGSNKLAFVDAEGTVAIYNQSDWYKDFGECYFSNKSYVIYGYSGSTGHTLYQSNSRRYSFDDNDLDEAAWGRYLERTNGSSTKSIGAAATTSGVTTSTTTGTPPPPPFTKESTAVTKYSAPKSNPDALGFFTDLTKFYTHCNTERVKQKEKLAEEESKKKGSTEKTYPRAVTV